jgi:hypothetical protein
MSPSHLARRDALTRRYMRSRIALAAVAMAVLSLASCLSSIR